MTTVWSWRANLFTCSRLIASILLYTSDGGRGVEGPPPQIDGELTNAWDVFSGSYQNVDEFVGCYLEDVGKCAAISASEGRLHPLGSLRRNCAACLLEESA